jgi:hypothetical protein
MKNYLPNKIAKFIEKQIKKGSFGSGRNLVPRPRFRFDKKTWRLKTNG